MARAYLILFLLAGCQQEPAQQDPLADAMRHERFSAIETRLAKLEAAQAQDKEAWRLLTSHYLAKGDAPRAHRRQLPDLAANDRERRLKALETEQYMRDQGIKP